MSRFLAIDADQGFVHVVSGTSRSGVTRLEKATTIDLGTQITTENVALLGKKLRDGLKDAGIAVAPVLLALGRDRLILKDAKIPNVPPSEEPAIVRFQVSKDQTEAADAVIIDYYPLSRLDPDGQRRVVTVSVRKDVLATYTALCQAAGLKIEGVTPRPLGTLAALERAIKSGDVIAPEAKHPSVAILSRGEKWGELLIARDNQVIFSRAITTTALNAEAMLLGEIRRNLAVYNGSAGAHPVEALYVAEGETGGWGARVRAGLTLPVQTFDPLAGVSTDVGPEARGHFAGIVGLLQLKALAAALPINFISPRQPKPKETPHRNLIITVASLLFLFVFGSMGFGYYLVNERSKEVARLVVQKNRLEETYKALEQDEKRSKAFKEWDESRINWLEELYDMTDRFPDINGTRLEQFRGEYRVPEKNSKSKDYGLLRLKLQTESGKFTDALQHAMNTDKKYHSIVPTSKGIVGGVGFTRFNQSYELKAEIERRAPDEYERVLKVKTPPKPSKQEEAGGFGGGGFGGGFGGPGS